MAGGLVGLLLAYWGTTALVSMLPPNQISALPFLQTLKIDARMLGFSFGLSVLTGMIFGLAPALQSSRLELSGVLKEGACADLCIFDAATVDETATFAHPIQPAKGIEVVIVNGEITWRDGKSTGARPGRVLRRQPG